MGRMDTMYRSRPSKSLTLALLVAALALTAIAPMAWYMTTTLRLRKYMVCGFENGVMICLQMNAGELEQMSPIRPKMRGGL